MGVSVVEIVQLKTRTAGKTDARPNHMLEQQFGQLLEAISALL